MNERSCAKALLRQVEDAARDHPENRVVLLRVPIDRRAEVDPELHSNAYDGLAPCTSLSSERLTLERAPPAATCDQCGHKFQVNRSQLACEKCGSLRLKMEESKELYVESIKFTEDSTMTKDTLIPKLRAVEFLKGFAPDLIEQIAKISRLRSFEQHETLFDENQFADKLYLIVSGSVLLEVCTAETGCKPILAVEAGEMLGWSSLTDERKYTARAVATEPVEVIQIDGNQMRAICDSDPRFGYEFLRRAMTALAKRLSVTWRQLGNVYLSHYLPFGVIPAAEND